MLTVLQLLTNLLHSRGSLFHKIYQKPFIKRLCIYLMYDVVCYIHGTEPYCIIFSSCFRLHDPYSYPLWLYAMPHYARLDLFVLSMCPGMLNSIHAVLYHCDKGQRLEDQTLINSLKGTSMHNIQENLYNKGPSLMQEHGAGKTLWRSQRMEWF